MEGIGLEKLEKAKNHNKKHTVLNLAYIGHWLMTCLMTSYITLGIGAVVCMLGTVSVL